MWEYANFEAGKSMEFPEPKVVSQWAMNSKLRVTNQGLLIRNMLIKTCSTTKQRALGTLISIKGRLIGNSSLWIFGRIDDEDADIQP